MSRRLLGRGRESRSIHQTRRERSKANSRNASKERFVSIPAAARSMQPTVPTTGRCRSASSYRRPSRTCSSRWSSRRRFGAPLLARGGGTSLAGQCCNVAVVLDFTKYLNKLIDLDPQAKTARVQPGIVLDWLRKEAEHHHLTFGPDPSTHNHNTLGGMIGNNSCGTHSVMAGKTEENVIELDILTYDGLRMRVGATTDEEYRAHRQRRRPARRDLHGTEANRRAPRRRDPPPFPEHSAPRVRLQPAGPAAGKRIQCGALAGRH